MKEQSSDCENRAGVLGLAPCHSERPKNESQVQVNDQFTLPPSYHSFVASGRYDGPDAPALKKFYIYSDVPRTHTQTQALTHTSLYTQKLLHREPFTQRSLYTEASQPAIASLMATSSQRGRASRSQPPRQPSQPSQPSQPRQQPLLSASPATARKPAECRRLLNMITYASYARTVLQLCSRRPKEPVCACPCVGTYAYHGLSVSVRVGCACAHLFFPFHLSIVPVYLPVLLSILPKSVCVSVCL